MGNKRQKRLINFNRKSLKTTEVKLTMINTYRPEGLIYGTQQNRELLSMGKAGLERAMSQGIIMEATALLCDSNMDLHIDLGGITGIIPRGEVCLCREGDEIKDIAVITRVGKPVCFKVMSLEERNGRTVAYLSRRQAQLECKRNYINDLIPGDVITSRVTHLETFGAFVDIGCGIISLLSIDSISVSRISHPSERLAVGDSIYTVVKSIDERGRIFVSARELLGSWVENAALFTEGETVRGIVRSVESYGIFVELTPNLAGLAEYKEDVREGQTAAVYIKSIIPEKMKIKLIIIDAHDTPLVPGPLEYFIDTDECEHISSWVYSPASCKRIIETIF